MRKSIFLLAILILTASLPMAAQQKKKDRYTFTEAVERLWKKTRKSVKNVGDDISGMFGTDTKLEGCRATVRVDGDNYMPLYSVDVYHGKDEANLRNACRALFAKKYPKATIQTVAIPQTEWLQTTVEKDGDIVGYRQLLFCYVIARDGQEGYINARFSFNKYKEVGLSFEPMVDGWPRWERTDVLTNKVYSKLLSK